MKGLIISQGGVKKPFFILIILRLLFVFLLTDSFDNLIVRQGLRKIRCDELQSKNFVCGRREVETG